MALYMLAIEPPLGNDNHRASKYLGYARDEGRVQDRLSEHLKGRGARMTKFAVEHGHNVTLIATAPGGRREERQAKNTKSHARVLAQWRKLAQRKPHDYKILAD